MDERFCTVGDVELCYETFGDPADPTVLLIMGLGAQMVAWHVDFCRRIAERGFQVVRFDNRDAGRSTYFKSPGPSMLQMLTRRTNPEYTLSDMAADAVGLLDHLGVDRAHVVGASMGGMIAQTVAIEHPTRVLSLTSIMSNVGDRLRGQPAFAVYPVLLRAAPTERGAFIEHVEAMFATIGSPDPADQDVADLHEMAELSFDRLSRKGPGAPRQLAAIIASGDRRRALRDVKVPTLVIHGTKDRLVRPSGGRATADAVPGARLLTIEGMGHDLPRMAWDRIVDAIAENAAKGALVDRAVSARA